MKKLLLFLVVAAVGWTLLCGIAPQGVDESSAARIKAVYSAVSGRIYSPLAGAEYERRVRDALKGPAIRPGDDRDVPAYLQRVALQLEAQRHISQSAAVDTVLHAVARATGDKYTEYLTPDELKSFLAPIDPAHIPGGIGILLDSTTNASQDARIFFVQPNTPAEKAGLESGDDIVDINGAATRGLGTSKVVSLLRGAAGSSLTMHVRHDGAVRELALTRTELIVPTVYFKEIPGTQFGYIVVGSFAERTGQEFHDAVQRLEAKHTKGIVVDFRFNGGGYVNGAVDLANTLQPSGPIVTVRERSGPMTTIEADATALPPLPTAILVNQYTASASEIAAAALRENGLAVLVGTRTYGKGVIQGMVRFRDGSAVKVTEAHYLTPQNHDINEKGLEPDIPVVINKGAVYGDRTRDTQLSAAITYLQNRTSG